MGGPGNSPVGRQRPVASPLHLVAGRQVEAVEVRKLQPRRDGQAADTDAAAGPDGLARPARQTSVAGDRCARRDGCMACTHPPVGVAR